MPGIVWRTSARVWALIRAISSAVTTVTFSAIFDVGRAARAGSASPLPPSPTPRADAGSAAESSAAVPVAAGAREGKAVPSPRASSRWSAICRKRRARTTP
jgi:hypothetical protein